MRGKGLMSMVDNLILVFDSGQKLLCGKSV